MFNNNLITAMPTLYKKKFYFTYLMTESCKVSQKFQLIEKCCYKWSGWLVWVVIGRESNKLSWCLSHTMSPLSIIDKHRKI